MNPTIRQHLLSTFPEFASSADAHLFDPESPIWDVEMPYTVPSPESTQSIQIANHDLVYHLVVLETQKDKHDLDTRPVWKTLLKHVDITSCWFFGQAVENLMHTKRLTFLDLFPPNIWRDADIQHLLRTQLLNIFEGHANKTIDDLSTENNQIYQWLVLMYHYVPKDDVLYSAFTRAIQNLPEIDIALMQYAVGERSSMWTHNPLHISKALESRSVQRYFPSIEHPLFFDIYAILARRIVVEDLLLVTTAPSKQIFKFFSHVKDHPITYLEGYSRFCASVAFFRDTNHTSIDGYQDLYHSFFMRHPDGEAFQKHVELCADLSLDPFSTVDSWMNRDTPALDILSTFEP